MVSSGKGTWITWPLCASPACNLILTTHSPSMIPPPCLDVELRSPIFANWDNLLHYAYISVTVLGDSQLKRVTFRLWFNRCGGCSLLPRASSGEFSRNFVRGQSKIACLKFCWNSNCIGHPTCYGDLGAFTRFYLVLVCELEKIKTWY